MKFLQKLILPALLIIAVVIVYVVYFSPSKDLGSFSDFDPNNSAVKDIRVMILQDRGIDGDSHGAHFYASDKNNNVVLVNADKIPDGIESANTVILRGHLSQNNSFHAHDVLLD
jgi:cytochrome c-type biogenesis protein CcmE